MTTDAVIAGVIAPAAAGDDPLRLTQCPKCDYSLHGLPDEGVCPECGYAYTQHYVVLRGMPQAGGGGGMNEMLTSRWSWFLGVAGFLAIGWVARQDPRNMYFLFYAVYLGAILALSAIRVFASERRGQSLVWIGRLGIGQQNDEDPERLDVRLRRALPILYGVGFCVIMFEPLLRHGHWFWFVVLTPTVGFVFGTIGRGGRPAALLPGDGTRPALFAWSTLRDLELLQASGDRYRLRARQKSRISSRWYAVDILVSLSAQQFAQLRDRLEYWSGQRFRTG